MIKFCFLLLMLGCHESDQKSSENSMTIRQQFLNWIIDSQKLKLILSSDFEEKLLNFNKSLSQIATYNEKNTKKKLKLNHFADISDEEFLSKFPTIIIPKKTFNFTKRVADFVSSFIQSVVPEINKIQPKQLINVKNIDWSSFFVHPIVNNSDCVVSYAFATIAAVEAVYLKTFGKPIKLSEQHMVSCGPWSGFGFAGCDGFIIDAPRKYAINYAFETEENFPWNGFETSCHKGKLPKVHVSTIETDFKNTKEFLVELEKGPIVAFMELNEEMKFWGNGVYDVSYPCGHFPNHAVVIVGFDLEAKIPFLKIRNSFGAQWGADGYAKVALRNLEDRAFCGLNSGYEFRPIIG